VLLELAPEVVDPLEDVGDALDRRARAGAPRLGLDGAPQRDRLLHLVGPRHVDECNLAEQRLEDRVEVGAGAARQLAGAGAGEEVVELAPHEPQTPFGVVPSVRMRLHHSAGVSSAPSPSGARSDASRSRTPKSCTPSKYSRG
jgi:hypothetical protein